MEWVENKGFWAFLNLKSLMMFFYSAPAVALACVRKFTVMEKSRFAARPSATCGAGGAYLLCGVSGARYVGARSS
ncbi:hypothetical protein EDC01DRAFT_484177 [Geopyxis carbonaria]|nr:hypothetical protein EDC01DRAFT_484177 [Geopyxis carbonaria]